MKIKVHIVGQALVMEEMDTGGVILDVPRFDYYYSDRILETEGRVQFKSLDYLMDIMSKPPAIYLADAVDGNGVSYTESSFKEFCRANLGVPRGVENMYDAFKSRVIADGGNFKDEEIVFNDEKLLLTPNAYKEGKLYSALPDDGSGDFAFLRNCNATYREDGIIKTALPNVPRIQDGKILIEGQATNMISNSELFSGTAHSETELVAVENPIKADAYIVFETGTVGRHSLVPVIVGVVSGLTYTMSLYCKKIQDDWVQLLLQTAPFSVDSWANFNIGNGTLGSKGDDATSHIEDLGNGWYKCSVTATAVGNGSSYSHLLIINNTDSGRYPSYLGVAGHESFYALAIEVKEEDKPSSYIPTDGATATRLADIATVTPTVGTTQIIETIDGVEQPPITVIPPTYQLPEGNINNVKMI